MTRRGQQVEVFKKPVVAIFSTGDEIYDIQAGTMPQEGGGMWDTNRPSLTAVLQGLGYEVVDLGIMTDELRPVIQRCCHYCHH
jgi:gephyrin